MIWCVEDDENIRELEIYSLQAAGFETRGFDNGSTFWETLQTESPRLVLLDIMLPGIDGIELLRLMRTQPQFMQIPVIMATVIGGEAHKARGLDSGADDYLVKPFSMIEMTARVRAILRRIPEPNEQQNGILLDRAQHLATLNGIPLELTFKEFKLLELFLARPGIAFSREQLLEIVWGEDYFRETRTVDVHIRSLRRKLGSWGERIETVRNVGYRLKRDIC